LRVGPGHRGVAPGIDDTYDSQRSRAGRVPELVWLARRDVNHVAEGEVLRLFAQAHLAAATEDQHGVFVNVLLERRVAARGDLEIADVKGGLLPLVADQQGAADAVPVRAGPLVLGNRDSLPAKALLKTYHARTGSGRG